MADLQHGAIISFKGNVWQAHLQLTNNTLYGSIFPQFTWKIGRYVNKASRKGCATKWRFSAWKKEGTPSFFIRGGVVDLSLPVKLKPTESFPKIIKFSKNLTVENQWKCPHPVKNQ